MDTDVPPSKLGTYDYWNEVYSEEVQNFNDHGDVGEIWFGMDTSKRIINWLSKTSWVEKSDTIIDLGCGNGMLLVGLYKAGFINLHGVDYSEKAIELASSISKSENCLINFTVGSILEDPVPSSYKVVLDKGTYDAISLDPDNSKAKRVIYIKNVCKMLKDDGIFLLTSCNWTEDEIIQQFSSSFDHVDTLKAPTFQFGGKVGKTVSSLVFKKKLNATL